MPQTPIGSDLVPGLDDWKDSVERRLKAQYVLTMFLLVAIVILAVINTYLVLR